MRAPLLEIKEKILAIQTAVDASLVALKCGLKQRADASEAREALERLLDTFHVASKLEKLTKELPSVTADRSNGHISSAVKDHASDGISLHNPKIGANFRETQSMLLERIASEMNRHKFYMALAQNMPFIENMEKRIQSASLLLDRGLGNCFNDALQNTDANAIYNCLRGYAAIDNPRNAEEIFRSTVVAPFVEKVVIHSSSGVVSGESTDELPEDYAKIKKHIEDDCKFLLEISFTENSGAFSFLANYILREVLTAIQKGKPEVFSPGRPIEFLKNYKASLDFLAYLEGYCHSRSAVAKFRAEPVYIEFMKQWNIGVYFSLRFQEIAGALDSALMVGIVVPSKSSLSEPKESQDFVLRQSISLLECLRSCWRDDALVLSCTDKFLRLTLQLLSRYSNWLSTGLAIHKSGEIDSKSGYEWAISATQDDFVFIIHDLENLVAEISGNYVQHVTGLLKSCPFEVTDLVKQGILQGAQSLRDILPVVMNSVVDSLVEKSVEALRQIEGIKATYILTNKPIPVRHSPYVSGVLRPIKNFLEGERAAMYLNDEIKKELLQRATFEITGHYKELATKLTDAMKALLKLRLDAQRQAGASSDVLNHNEFADKICMQLFLDVQEYGRNLYSMGIDAAAIPAYQSLWQCVAPPNRQNTILF